MKNLTILVGLPGCGKSTWRDRMTGPDTVVCSTDDLIEQYAASVGKTYSEVFRDVIDAAEKTFKYRFKAAIKAGKDIIVDRTNLTAKSRRDYIDAGLMNGYDVGAVVLARPETDADHDEWNERLNRPGKVIPKEVLADMFARFEQPSFVEGFVSIANIDNFGVANDLVDIQIVENA
jgi:predicted kinase